MRRSPTARGAGGTTQPLLGVPFVVLGDVGLDDPQLDPVSGTAGAQAQTQRADRQRRQHANSTGTAIASAAAAAPVMNKGAVSPAAATVSRLSP